MSVRLNEFNQPIGEDVPNWKGAIFPSRSHCLTGNYCVLVPVDVEKHSQDLYDALNYNNKGESWTYLPIGPYENFQDFKAWLLQLSTKSDVVTYVIIDEKTKKPVGTASYLRINPEHGTIEVGHLHFSKLLKRSTTATEAMFLMMRYAFEDLNYRRYEWKCDNCNELSKKAALRFGFTFEGIFRKSMVYKGRNRDTAWFAILHDDWPAQKARFLTWLDKSNFDVNGIQIKRLNEC